MSRTAPLTERGRSDLGVVEAHSDTLVLLLLMAQLVDIRDQENSTWRRSRRQPSRP
jgi:hypothetical protein